MTDTTDTTHLVMLVLVFALVVLLGLAGILCYLWLVPADDTAVPDVPDAPALRDVPAGTTALPPGKRKCPRPTVPHACGLAGPTRLPASTILRCDEPGCGRLWAPAYRTRSTVREPVLRPLRLWDARPEHWWISVQVWAGVVGVYLLFDVFGLGVRG